VDRPDRGPGADVEVEVGCEEELRPAAVALGRGFPELAHPPVPGVLAVLEPGIADQFEVDFAFDAFGDSHE
jgi:hypothetical protein